MSKQTPSQKRKSAKRMLEKKLPAKPGVRLDDTVLSPREIRRLIKAL